jgi:membrane dipeptidase
MEARGIRSIQLTHLLANELGDIQTALPVHGGLTGFGAEAVRRMNRLGIIVDVAHCSEDTVKGVATAATRPLVCSHANLKEPGHPNGDHPRFIGPDYARMVVESGGVAGAWIAVLTEEKLPGLIRHLFRMIDALGIDHVAIGTDLPAGVARTELPGFSRHPEIAASLVDRGLTREETDKVCSVNWLRVLRTVRS